MSHIEPIILMNSARIRRTIERMAFQMAEQVGDGPLLLIGVNRKGTALSQSIESILVRRIGAAVSSVSVGTETVAPASVLASIQAHPGPVFLVDDVIFTGRTLHRILRWLPELDERASLSVCVLIDRGHREVPVHPAITGLTLPTKPGEHIEVRMRERQWRSLEGREPGDPPDAPIHGDRLDVLFEEVALVMEQP